MNRCDPLETGSRKLTSASASGRSLLISEPLHHKKNVSLGAAAPASSPVPQVWRVLQDPGFGARS